MPEMDVHFIIGKGIACTGYEPSRSKQFRFNGKESLGQSYHSKPVLKPSPTQLHDHLKMN